MHWWWRGSVCLFNQFYSVDEENENTGAKLTTFQMYHHNSVKFGFADNGSSRKSLLPNEAKVPQHLVRTNPDYTSKPNYLISGKELGGTLFSSSVVKLKFVFPSHP